MIRTKSNLPALDTDLLTAFVLKKDRAWLYSHSPVQLTLKQQKKLDYLLRQRGRGVPLAYLTGHKEFFGLDFLVNKHVLVPRPETEILVETVIENIKNLKSQITNQKFLLIDIGTGSGCIPIAVMKNLEHTNTEAIATDISAAALKVAKRNAKKHGVKIKFLRGNLLKPITQKITNQKSQIKNIIITANLPYLTARETAAVKHEPKTALYGGLAGLDIYKKLFSQLTRYCPQLKYIYLEIGRQQAAGIKKLAKKYWPDASLEIKKDLAGFDRVIFIKL